MGLRNKYLFAEEKFFFVTTTCVKWMPLIEKSNSYTLLGESLAFVCRKYNAVILGYVIMPNHLHLILYFEEENHLSALMRDFKKFTSTQIRKSLETKGLSSLLKAVAVNKKGRNFQVWQDRFDEVYLKDRKLLERKLDYLHLNPLQEKWSLSKYPEDYPYSSAKFYEGGECTQVPVTHYMDYL